MQKYVLVFSTKHSIISHVILYIFHIFVIITVISLAGAFILPHARKLYFRRVTGG